KHTSEGVITLNASLREKPGYLTLSVTDTGIGVPADKAEIIFERFEKLNIFSQGSGLGLAICKLIADMLKGDVRLDTSYTGGGARFVFEIPN
ncbi:MAG: HAMP domain-containing histidine kinase, partial [Bacteroidales bacterium]|nr:HAMP domain-containing histidine kinase [Bacteroidales bacterium]